MSEQSSENTVRPGVRSPEEIHAEQISDQSRPAAEVEVLEEVGPQPSKSVPVDLPNGTTIQVPLMTEWRSSALQFMQTGDFDSWAESVLTEADLGAWDDWMNTDPLLGEQQEFFAAVGKATGGAAAGNRALRRQLRRTQGR